LQRYLASVRHATQARHAEALVERVLNASPGDVPDALKSLGPLDEFARPLLRARFEDSPDGSRHQLHAAFALAALGEAPREFLVRRIADVPNTEAGNLLDALAAAKDRPVAELLRHIEQEASPEGKARYAIALLHLGDPRGAKRVLGLSPD